MITRILKMLVIAAAASAAPLTTKRASIVSNDACALPIMNGTCCPNGGAICAIGASVRKDMYRWEGGKCPPFPGY